MKITSIKFERPLLGHRSVVVELSDGGIYTIKSRGRYAYVAPPCADNERPLLSAVYDAAWEWLSGAKINKGGYTLDAGAKRACGRIVGYLAWPACYEGDTEMKLHYVVDRFTSAQDIIC